MNGVSTGSASVSHPSEQHAEDTEVVPSSSNTDDDGPSSGPVNTDELSAPLQPMTLDTGNSHSHNKDDPTDIYHQVQPMSGEPVGFKPGPSKSNSHRGIKRYRRGLKHAYPLRTSKPPSQSLPLDSAGLFNYVTFSWLTPYLWTVYRYGTAPLMHLSISEQEGAELNAERMGRFWEEEVSDRGEVEASFGRAVFRSFRTRIIIGAVVSLVYALLTLANPIFVIRYFLAYLSEGEVSLSTGIVYPLMLALVLLLRGLTGAFLWMLNFEAAARIKSGSLALLYSKLLRLKSLGHRSVGDMVNLVSNDGVRLWSGVIMGPFILGAPMILFASCAYGLVYLGPWALLSFFLILGFFPFAITMARLSQKLRTGSIKITDKRVGLLVELLSSIKLVKMYAWELSFAQKIAEIRVEERELLERSLFIQSVSMGSSMLAPLMASCLTFIGYVATGNNLTATQAFTFVSLLNTIQASMATLPFALKAISEMLVTTKRIQEILLMEEMGSYPQLPASSENIVEMVGASFSWHSLRQTSRSNSTEEETQPGRKRRGRRNKSSVKAEKEEQQGLKENKDLIFVGPTLKDVTFTLKKKQLVSVCGSVGSGKTSLINAMLGKMELSSGHVSMCGGPIAYVPQQAWLARGSVRDNILFGQPYIHDRYQQVIQVCGLQEDLDSLSSGDCTEVGEGGASLSGGQKQRVSLARAAYSTHSLVLLDDPLSAVDVGLAKHIFQKCIVGWLASCRTVVFVSHSIEFMKDCDHILVIKDGSIVEQGTHQQLLNGGHNGEGEVNVPSESQESDSPLSSPVGEYATLVRLHLTQRKAHTDRSSSPHEGQGETILVDESEQIQQTPRAGLVDEGFPAKSPDVVSDHNSNGLSCKLTTNDHSVIETATGDKGTKEEAVVDSQGDTGALSRAVLHQWILSMGGYPVAVLVFIVFCLPVAGVTMANWYLSYWIDQGGGVVNGTESLRVVDNPDLSTYLIQYGSFIPALILLTLVRSFALMKSTLCASSTLHDKGFRSILHRPMSFFHATSVGTIINRFSADQDEMDTVLPTNVEVFTNNILQVLAAVITVSYVSPWFCLAALPLAALFLILMVAFHVCFRRLKCMDHVTCSPVLAHQGASVLGLDSVQAYGAQAQFFDKHCKLLDQNCVALLLFQMSSRWLALRLDLVSAGVALTTGLLILANWQQINPAFAGLALAFALQMSGLFQFTARLAVETEARFTSVQRMLEYCNFESKEPLSAAVSEPATSWPSGGAIKFTNVSLRYDSDSPLALSDVSFDVKPHQKIGIVGRSGAGKTSITSALYRLFEIESGKICVDNVNIRDVPVQRLRAALSAIPQDPVLFAGTLRYNLDPFGEFSDSDLWHCLEACHASEMVKTSDLQLNSLVLEGGSNFSVGERQLLCLARALLRRSKILVLDEATAAVDAETDALIRDTLSSAFPDCTMLVVAHRLASVLWCDRILVMDSGMVVEYDTPSSLMSDQSSKFKAMLMTSESKS